MNSRRERRLAVLSLVSLASCANMSAARAEPKKEQPPQVEHDPLTNIAIGVTAYTLAATLHEGLGHETGCALGGGNPTGFSLALAQCPDEGLSPGGFRGLTAGGAAANMLAGTGFASALLFSPPKDGNLYYFMWLSTVVNLYQAAGYLMIGPWVPAGDFGEEGFVRDVSPRLPYQLGLSALGLGLTAGTLFLGNHLAEPLLGDEGTTRRSRQWSTTVVPYFAGSMLVAGSSLLNRDGPGFALSAAVANFFGTLFLAYTPLFFSSDTFYPSRTRGSTALDMPRSPLWIAIGTATAVTAITVLGPGIGSGFENRHPFDPTGR